MIDSIYTAADETKKLSISKSDDARIPNFPSGPAIKFANQGTFHPTKYLRALAQVVEAMGGRIHESTRYMSHEEDTNKMVGGVKATMADGQEVMVNQLVMATNVPLQKVIEAVWLCFGAVLSGQDVWRWKWGMERYDVQLEGFVETQ